MTRSQPLRIGILQTDSVRPEFLARHGDYPDMFRGVLREAAARTGEPLELLFTDYDVQHGVYPERIDEQDAYLITGSRDSVYDDLDWIRRLQAFVLELHEQRHPMVGICFGHQLVAQALGGATRPADAGWGVGVQEARLVAPLPFTDAAAERFAMISSHKDQVTELPAGARLLAASDFCPIAAFGIGDHFLCFQGHPEFSKAYSEALMRFRAELLGAETLERGLASLACETQSLDVARWMLDFMARRGQA